MPPGSRALADEEAIDVPLLLRFDERMAGGLAELGKVLARARIGGKRLQQVAGRDVLECLARAQDGQRTFEALGVEHSGHPQPPGPVGFGRWIMPRVAPRG